MIDDDTIIGKICFGTSCLIFLTPNSVYIETSLFSSYFWKIHGVFIKDLNIVFPNANGIILAKVQIFIFLQYKGKYPGIDGRESSSIIGIETNENEKEIKDEDNTNKGDEETPVTNKEKPAKIVSKVDN